MVFTRRLTASAVNGPPRSVSKMKAPVVFRCSSRSMRNSSPRMGWTAGLPFFALRTCSAGLRPHSTCDHSRSAISTGGLGFGNQALGCHLRVGDSFRRGLLMDGKLLFLQFSYSCSDVRLFSSDD